MVELEGRVVDAVDAGRRHSPEGQIYALYLSTVKLDGEEEDAE